MKMLNKFSVIGTLAVAITFGLAGPITALAASTPSLGNANTFGILSSTYTNTAGGTTVDGDLGYTTGPATAPTVTGTTHVADGVYNQAGIDQNAALTNLNNQSCTSLGTGAVALDAIDIGNGPGVFTPGCYSSGGAMDITVDTTVTLDGAGTYIFRPAGALTTAADSTVDLINGASECDVFWTPTGATTLGANSTFAGTNIDAAGISIGDTVTWAGKALAFGGTVSTAGDTITVPTCTSSGGILRIVKSVVNNSGRTATAADFNLHVKLSGTDVTGSPAIGTGTPGTSYSLDAGAYTVSEDANAFYTKSFGGDCDSSGNVTISAGNDKTCTVTNNDISEQSANGRGAGGSGLLPSIHVTKVPNPLALPSGPGSVAYTYKVTNVGDLAMSNVWLKDDKCSPVNFISGDRDEDSMLDLDEIWTYRCTTIVSETVTNTATTHGFAEGVDVYDTAKATVVVSAPIPNFPNAGSGSDSKSGISWSIFIPSGIFVVLFSFFLVRKKRII